MINTKVKELPKIELIGFEAKASLADYKNGFNAGADKTYIIAPKGIIPKDIIPEGIGLYEVDLDNYKVSNGKKGIMVEGVTLVKRAAIRHKGRHYKTKVLRLLYIAQRATNMDLYKNNKIQIYERK